ncbi:MAG: cytochrome B6 [Gammaproteobacteria bacterium]|nr:cytochrome B6 [Gammaproteobacteria bacterium]
MSRDSRRPCEYVLRRTRLGVCVATVVAACAASAQQPAQDDPPEAQPARGATSYMPVALERPFQEIYEEFSARKEEVMERARNLLEQRYDLSDRPVQGVTMTRGKPVQGGVRVRLPEGVSSWEELAAMPRSEIAARNLFPEGFKPLPHPFHEEGGMVFPQHHIDEILAQEQRDLNRFDVEFDIPEHFLPEFPPPIFLTTRPELGDVSQGQLVTTQNFFELFNGILNPKQLEGLRLLVSPFPQQQFNMTNDRRSEKPHLGVSCFDCHANGHTNASTHLVGDIRPQEVRRRIDTPTLRGVQQQRLFGSQRALRTVEDFTEFEQRAAYFDGDIVIAQKKGVNFLERGSEVHAMAEFQEILDFPPAPKLDPFGRLDPELATEQELRGEQIFFGKGRCFECHPPPIFSDNFMHDLKVERFYNEDEIVNGRKMSDGGPTKTFPLRGIKDSPPYLHDGRLLTLDDAVEFFNLVLGLQLNAQEKQDLVRYLYTL